MKRNSQPAKTAAFKPYRRHRRSQLSLIVVSFVSAAVGLLLLQTSFAAYSHDARGYLDSCTASGTTTTVYGWAHDPDVAAGAQPSVQVTIGGVTRTAASSIAGYRDSAINDYLKDRGIPTSSVYGFTASFSNLYKGTTYRPSGTVLNVGTGANTALPINDIKSVESRPYFPGNTLPDACLVARPATPAPSPAPTPTPSPAPTPTPTPRPSTPSTRPASPPSASPTPTPTLAAASAAAITGIQAVSGSYGSVLTVQTTSATSVKAIYGQQADQLTKTTADSSAADDQVKLKLEGLKPATTYYYQVVATDAAGLAATSQTDSFKTLGYTVSATISVNSIPLQNISVELAAQKKQAVTDAKGTVSFSDLPSGSYTLSYKYKGKAYQTPFTTATATDSQGTALVSVKLDPASSYNTAPATAKSSHSSLKLGALLLAILALLAGLVFAVRFVRRRIGRSRHSVQDFTPYQPPAAPVVIAPPSIAPSPQRLTETTRDDTEGLHYVGRSLKDMVLNGVSEETKRRNDREQ